jgi:hypothetical protein
MMTDHRLRFDHLSTFLTNLGAARVSPLKSIVGKCPVQWLKPYAMGMDCAVMHVRGWPSLHFQEIFFTGSGGIVQESPALGALSSTDRSDGSPRETQDCKLPYKTGGLDPSGDMKYRSASRSGRCVMVRPLPSKQEMRVRFPPPAPK